MNVNFLQGIRLEMARPPKPGQSGILNILPANDWIRIAKDRPDPKSWFHGMIVANENTVLFAVSNVGKSILAVQIAEDIARDERVLSSIAFLTISCVRR